MKEVNGIWLPDGEEHLVKLNVSDYQGDKRRAALEWVKNWRTAVDVGAHCGLWSRHLALVFKDVHAFEPVSENRECFKKNVPGNVLLYGCALGAKSGSVEMVCNQNSSAGAHVGPMGDIPMSALDEFDLQDVDLLKVDCVGYEVEVLKGARETLERCRPVVSVEQKAGYPQRFGLTQFAAVEFLTGLGAVIRSEKSGVYVLSW